jgi:hypothetical protein
MSTGPRAARAQRVQSGIRCALRSSTCVALLAAVALVLPAVAQGALPQPVYFFADTAEPINSRNPFVIRPKGFLMFQDGQWVLERLHWTGWGSRVAQATGISSASNDIPNAAQGKRIKTSAHVTLSSPGRFRGHEVYRCFKLTIRAYPRSDQNLCLGHAHNLYLLEPVKHVAPAPHVSNPQEFRVGLMTGTMTCAVAAEGSICQGVPTVPEGTDPLVQVAKLQPSGQLTSCSEYEAMPRSTCFEGNFGDPIPSLHPGQASTVGPFTCKVLNTGVECTVTATGKGFLITPGSVTQIGG